MLYHIIKYKDGTLSQCPASEYSEKQIMELSKKEIESIVQREHPPKEKPLVFEVRMSYDDTKNLFVTEKELPFVYFAMENNTVLYIAGGAIRGQNIIDVLPDYNSYMKWNRDYKPSPEDYAYIGSQTKNKFRDAMLKAKNMVRQSGNDQKLLVSLTKDKKLLLDK